MNANAALKYVKMQLFASLLAITKTLISYMALMLDINGSLWRARTIKKKS